MQNRPRIDLDRLDEIIDDPELIEKYRVAQQAQAEPQTATATQSATENSPSELGNRGVADGSASPGGREGLSYDELPEATADLLNELIAYARQYAVFSSDAQAIALVLFVMNTYVYDVWDYTPYLSLSSATKRAGKTRLLNVLKYIVARPWLALTPTEATLFRKIDEQHPTLLVDESDTITPANREAIRALLNAGFESEQTVPRMMGEGKDMRVVDFNVYCPKVLAGIGRYLSDSTQDRTIPIVLKRKTAEQKLQRFRKRRVKQQTQALKERLDMWATTTLPVFEEYEPELPEELHDRAADIWEPLLAIADLAGGSWPERARTAAIQLHTEGKEAEAENVLLLRHLRDIFQKDGGIAIHTVEILHSLTARDDGPWAKLWATDLGFANVLRPAQGLAELLKDFDIHSRDVKVKGENRKGYRRDDFMDAWQRYLDDEASPGPTPQEALLAATPRFEPVTCDNGSKIGSASGSGRGSRSYQERVLEPSPTIAAALARAKERGKA